MDIITPALLQCPTHGQHSISGHCNDISGDHTDLAYIGTYKYKHNTPPCIMKILEYNRVLLAKVKTWKTAFGEKNMYFVSPTYPGQHVRDDLSADNQCLLGNENINIIA